MSRDLNSSHFVCFLQVGKETIKVRDQNILGVYVVLESVVVNSRYRQLLRGDNTRYKHITLIDAFANVIGYKHVLVNEVITLFVLFINVFIDGENVFIRTQNNLVGVIF